MISVRLNQSLEQELTRFSQLNQLTKTDIVKEALIHYFKTFKSKEKPTAYELGANFFGKYGSEEGDLSITYKQRLNKRINEKNNYR
ncbi:MAG: CopG family transcriptional regulator [Sulfurovum sp.]|nr:MAG: CopG family transcriptional regulator [Sulfurovum sp.]